MSFKAQKVLDFLSQLDGFFLDKTGYYILHIETGATISLKYTVILADLDEDYYGKTYEVLSSNQETLVVEINGQKTEQHYSKIVKIYLAKYALLHEAMTGNNAKEEFQSLNRHLNYLLDGR